MKKQILISTAIVAAIIGGTTFTVLNNANAVKTDDLVAATAALSNPTKLSTSKNETVYVMTDESGAAKTKYIGSNLYTGTEELPFSFKITYYLDGNEISAKDLKGKSGHVKIVYTYDSVAKYLNKNVPFVAITGLTLNRNNFENVKLTNGKVVTETSDNYIIAGYTITGLNQNLNIDMLPNSFALEADVKDFKLGDSYTIFTNELLADIDTSKLNDIESLKNSIYQLSDALDQIIAGTSELSNGIDTLNTGTKALYTGSQTLVAGLTELESHNEELIAGATEIKNLAPSIASLMQEKLESLKDQLQELNDKLEDLEAKRDALEPYKSVEPYKTQYEQVIDGIKQVNAGIAQVNAGIAQLSAGLQKLPQLQNLYDGIVDYTDGVAKVNAGAQELSAGLGSLVEGTEKLSAGATTLSDGLNTFKSEGIDKLVKLASVDLTNFVNNLRSSVNAASSYHHYGDSDALNVKFIVKTPSI